MCAIKRFSFCLESRSSVPPSQQPAFTCQPLFILFLLYSPQHSVLFWMITATCCDDVKIVGIAHECDYITLYWRFPCHSEGILGSELNDEHDTRSLDWHLLRICCVRVCHALRRHKLRARHILSTYSGSIIKQSVNETHHWLTLRLTISFFVWMNLIACELTPLLPRWHAHVRWRMENFLNFRSDVFIHISHIIIEYIIHIHIWAKLLFSLGIIDWMENFCSRIRYQRGERAAMASDERLERGKTVCQTRVNYHQVDEWVALIVVVWISRSTRCSFPPRSLQNLPSRQRGNLIFGSNHRQHTAGRVEHARKRTRARVEMESKQRKRFHSSFARCSERVDIDFPPVSSAKVDTLQ